MNTDWRRCILILIPMLWLLVFFLAPFFIVLKISLSDLATAIIKQLRAKTKKETVIIGVGGISNPEEAKIKLAAGADLIQIYTGLIYEGPQLIKKIKAQLV